MLSNVFVESNVNYITMFAISNTNWFSFKRANIQMKRNSFDPSNSIYQYLKDFFVFQLNSNPWQSNRWLITCYCLVAMHRSRKMKHGNWTFIMHFNPLMFSVTFLYPLKTSEKRRFSDVFRGYQNETLDINGLRKDIVLFIFFSIVFFKSIQILKSIPR